MALKPQVQIERPFEFPRMLAGIANHTLINLLLLVLPKERKALLYIE